MKMEDMQGTHIMHQILRVSDPEDIQSVINCLTAPGRFQEALDFAVHWM